MLSLLRPGRRDDRSSRRPRWRRRHLAVEALEGRQLLATFTVTSPLDSGTGTLRAAIAASNATTGPNTIRFNISGGSLQRIGLSSPLPALTHTVTIDGTTEPGAGGRPVIQIDGFLAGSAAVGLTLGAAASGSTIRGLTFTDFSGGGLLVDGASHVAISNDIFGFQSLGGNFGVEEPNANFGVELENGANHDTLSGLDVVGFQCQGVVIIGTQTSNNTVQNCNLGIDPTGTDFMDLVGHVLYVSTGIAISGGASYNTITGNVIPFYENFGVRVSDAGTAGNLFTGNEIGTYGNGQGPGGGPYGVFFGAGTTKNTVGGTSAAARNLIAGSSNAGVYFSSAESGNLVEGNFIGTDASGTIPRPNAIGVAIEAGATGNTIGGSAAGARNVISGNISDGVLIQGNGASSNLLEGNFIGTDSSGTQPLGNGGDGVLVEGGAMNNTIGGSAAAPNIISGNGASGVHLLGPGTVGNVVAGNDIGTILGGTRSLPNHDGVTIEAGAASNLIGGTVAAALNIISGNGGTGVHLLGSGTTGNVVEGDRIGTDISGLNPLPNGTGVVIEAGATGNTIGGSAAGVRNVISGNSSHGVLIQGSGTSFNVVAGDFIGTDAAGAHPLSNGGDGVMIQQGAAGNTVGGTTAGARNVLSGNLVCGVYLLGAGTSANVVEGNYIGTDSRGLRPVGNLINGVDIVSGATGNLIGGTTAAAGNLVSGNQNNGVVLAFAGTSSNGVEGNEIGTAAGGVFALPNIGDGVDIQFGAFNNVIGGLSPGLGNEIAGNGRDGIWITGAGTNGNQVLGNTIGTNSTGVLPLGNYGNGVRIDSGASSNLVGAQGGAGVNIIAFNQGNGVLIAGSSTAANLILYAVIVENGQDGISLDQALWTTILGCTIEINAWWGIQLGQSLGTSLQYNILSGNFYGDIG